MIGKSKAYIERLNNMEERIKMLECPHKRTEIKRCVLGFPSKDDLWEKVCCDCGKGLEVMLKEEKLAEELKRAKEEVKRLEALRKREKGEP